MRREVRRCGMVVGFGLACLILTAGAARAGEKAEAKPPTKEAPKQAGPVENCEYYCALAESHSRYRQHDKALEAATKGEGLAASEKEKGMCLLLKARCLRAAGKEAEAVKAAQDAKAQLEAALQKKADDAQVKQTLERLENPEALECAYQCDLANTQARFRHFEEAMAAVAAGMEKAKTGADKARCLDVKARCLMAQGQKDEALKTAEDALAADKSPQIVSSAAGLMMGLGKTEEARKLAQEAMEKNPKDKGLERLYWTATLAHARKLAGDGQTDDAMKLAKEALDKNAEDKWVQQSYNDVAATAAAKMVAAGKVDDGLTLMRGIVDKNPDNASMNRLMINLYLTAKRPDDATALCKKQIETAKTDEAKVDYLFLGAEIAMKNQDADAALACLNKVKEAPDVKDSHKRAEGMVKHVERMKEAKEKKPAPPKEPAKKKEEAEKK